MSTDPAPAWALLVADALARRRVAQVRDVLAPDVLQELRERAALCDRAGAMAPARIGRRAGHHADPRMRGDRIAWLDEATAVGAERAYFAALQALRACLNRELMLGLADLEAHYAIYPPGAAYARHRDRFRDDDARQVSVILYLNDGWRAEHGGALRIHVGEAAFLDVLPEAGTLVAFAAEAFEHEVLPAVRERLAVTGWLRRSAGLPW